MVRYNPWAIFITIARRKFEVCFIVRFRSKPRRFNFSKLSVGLVPERLVLAKLPQPLRLLKRVSASLLIELVKYLPPLQVSLVIVGARVAERRNSIN
jgi:hypothetical protein